MFAKLVQTDGVQSVITVWALGIIELGIIEFGITVLGIIEFGMLTELGKLIELGMLKLGITGGIKLNGSMFWIICGDWMSWLNWQGESMRRDESMMYWGESIMASPIGCRRICENTWKKITVTLTYCENYTWTDKFIGNYLLHSYQTKSYIYNSKRYYFITQTF